MRDDTSRKEGGKDDGSRLVSCARGRGSTYYFADQFQPGENSSLAMHLKPTEVDDVENSINRIEADIDRPIKPFFGNLMQSSTVHHGPCRAIPKP